METATSTLSVLPSSKEQVQLFASKLIDELENGQVNPLDLVKMQKCIEKTFEIIKPKLSELSRSEAEKYGKSFDYKGVKIELAEVGTKYDFSQCGHTDYNSLCAEIAELNEKKKAMEAMLKSFKEPQNMIDSNGEAITVYPPNKTSTSSIKVTV